MSWVAAVGALGGGLLNAAQASSQQRRLRRIGRQNERELTALQGENALLGDQALQDIDAARKTVAGGYRRAIGSTRGAFLRADRGARLQGRQDMAAAEMNLLRSGRSNTGLLNLARQGVSFNTAMQLNEIARSLSGALAPLQLGAAQDDASLQLGKTGARAATFNTKANLQRQIHGARLGQVPDVVDASGGFGALADLFEQLFQSKPSNGAANNSTQAVDDAVDDIDVTRDDGAVRGMV